MNRELFKGQSQMPKKSIKYPENAIGKRLKNFRKGCLEITLVELSLLLNVSQGSLSDLENGNALPSANTFRELYYAGCCINWLLTGEE